MKRCIKCKVEKEFIEFHKNKKAKDGVNSCCKSCKKEYYKANKERYQEYNKANKEKIKEQKKEYYQDNKERYQEYSKEYYQKYYQYNQEKSKEYYKANKERIKEYKKQYQQANKEHINEYKKERRLKDPLFKMIHNLRNRTWSAFKNKGYRKTSKTQEMLGVNWEVCKLHIEKQFTNDMTWDNQGEWHIDHIIPLASAKTEEELKKLCHYSNLQPLWAVDNIIKSAKINGQQTLLRI
jgi:hypothetical protein